MNREPELIAILRAEPWFMHVLDVVASINPPEWLVGAGVIRDVVWDTRFGTGFNPALVKDVDVVFFDSADLTAGRDKAVEASLARAEPGVHWDAKNQAAVHLWYPDRFGYEVP